MRSFPTHLARITLVSYLLLALLVQLGVVLNGARAHPATTPLLHLQPLGVCNGGSGPICSKDARTGALSASR
jgi:hypothetical protein